MSKDTRNVTTRSMYKWVSAYPTISGYGKMKRWPTFEELCDMFDSLLKSRNMSETIKITYPDVHREGNLFVYNAGDNDL